MNRRRKRLVRLQHFLSLTIRAYRMTGFRLCWKPNSTLLDFQPGLLSVHACLPGSIPALRTNSPWWWPRLALANPPWSTSGSPSASSSSLLLHLRGCHHIGLTTIPYALRALSGRPFSGRHGSRDDLTGREPV